MELTSNTIPAWLIASLMIYTGWIWLASRKHKIRMDSRIFATTFLIWGVVYGILFQILSIEIELRGFMSRLMIMIVCLSQAMPLTVSYIRSRRRGD